MEENKPDKAVKKKSVGKVILAIILISLITIIAILSYHVFCIVLSSLLSYMFDIELDIEDIYELKYAGDGKHVCIILQHLRDGSDLNADYDLYYASTDLKDPRYISDGVQDVRVSPSGKYILYYIWEAGKLVVFDVVNFEVKAEYDRFVEEYGWNPNEKEIWYRTSKGIYIRNLKTSKEKKIINDPEDKYTPFGWSEDGRHFTYANDLNKVYLFDSISKKTEVVDVQKKDLYQVIHYYQML